MFTMHDGSVELGKIHRSPARPLQRNFLWRDMTEFNLFEANQRKPEMLWLDADARRTLDEKVQRAVDYYRQKYGAMPDLCLVNSAAFAER